jgi:eukaryotic-like serine/threonine-protein kinase
MRLTAAVIGLLLVGCADSPWYKYASNPENNGRAVRSTATAGMPEWTFQASGSIGSNAILDSNGVVYVTSIDGSVYAVNGQTGQAIWTQTYGVPIRNTPAIENGVLYYGADDGKLHALSTQDGRPLWEFPTRDRIVAAPLPSGGIVFVPSLDGSLYAVDIATHMAVWQKDTKAQLWTSPAFSPSGAIYVCGDDQKVHAIDTGTHDEIWVQPMGGPLSAAPAVGVVNQAIYVGSDDGVLHALRPSDGQELWRYQAPIPGGWATAAVIYYGGNSEVVYAASRTTLVALDANGGRVLWHDPAWFEGGYNAVSQPAVVPNGPLFISANSTASGSYLVAADSQSGTKQWLWFSGIPMLNWPAVGLDGKVYVTSADNNLYKVK